MPRRRIPRGEDTDDKRIDIHSREHGRAPVAADRDQVAAKTRWNLHHDGGGGI